MRRLQRVLLLGIAFIPGLLPQFARAESIAAKSCATFKETKDAKRQAVYLAFLEGQANAANHDPRYVLSETSLADAAQRLLDWCGQNPSRSFGEAVTAVLNSNDNAPTFTKPSIAPLPPAKKPASQSSPPPTPKAPPPEVSKTSPPAKPPTLSCKVGRTNYCAGCNISCEVGQQAVCARGRDNELGAASCGMQAKCACE